MSKILNYYAVMYEINTKRIFIIKSPSFDLIENKFRDTALKFSKNGSYCLIAEKKDVERLLVINLWVSGADLYFRSCNEKFKVYFHKSHRKTLPQLHLEEFSFVSVDPIRDATGIIKLSEKVAPFVGLYPFMEKRLMKNCQVSFMPIKDNGELFDEKILFDRIIDNHMNCIL